MLKQCPFCFEEIQLEAIKCKHCGEWLNTKPSPTGIAGVTNAIKDAFSGGYNYLKEVKEEHDKKQVEHLYFPTKEKPMLYKDVTFYNSCLTVNNISYDYNDIGWIYFKREVERTNGVRTKDIVHFWLLLVDKNETHKSVLVSKAIKSILNRSAGLERFTFKLEGGFVDFSYENLRMLHIKNFKGVFYSEHKVPIPAKYRIEVVMDGDQDIFSVERFKQICDTMDVYLPHWKISGHENIFKYKLGILDVESGTLTKFDSYSPGQFIFGILVYHDEIISFVCAGTQYSLGKLFSK